MLDQITAGCFRHLRRDEANECDRGGSDFAITSAGSIAFWFHESQKYPFVPVERVTA
jgi:hypothetical protein